MSKPPPTNKNKQPRQPAQPKVSSRVYPVFLMIQHKMYICELVQAHTHTHTHTHIDIYRAAILDIPETYFYC